MYKIDGDTLSTSCNISLAPLASDFSCVFHARASRFDLLKIHLCIRLTYLDKCC